MTVLAALAAVTDHIGLSTTMNTTFNEPFEVARQFATLDHLSGGRAAWNAVTSPDAFTGANFRRGGFLDPAERYERAAEMIAVVRELWGGLDAGTLESETPDLVHGRRIFHEGRHFTVTGRVDLARCPQGQPVVIQAGDSDQGRELAARDADVIFSRHAGYESGRTFYRDVKARLAHYGRAPEELKILPAGTVVLGDTEADAEERSRDIRRRQISPQGAIAYLEQIWGRDLSGYDPDGPLPEVDPDVEGSASISAGRVRHGRDPLTTAASLRRRAEAGNLSIRELVVEVSTGSAFVGTPRAVAETINRYVQQDAADGYILIPQFTPHGLDEFVERVVPELIEMGVYRNGYKGRTLRHHLGLSAM